jgi:hypothetical protein
MSESLRKPLAHGHRISMLRPDYGPVQEPGRASAGYPPIEEDHP